MDNITNYVKESYSELVHHVTWPTWPVLLENTRIVLIASIIFALLVFVMNLISDQVLEYIYGLS